MGLSGEAIAGSAANHRDQNDALSRLHRSGETREALNAVRHLQLSACFAPLIKTQPSLRRRSWFRFYAGGDPCRTWPDPARTATCPTSSGTRPPGKRPYERRNETRSAGAEKVAS